MSHTGVHSGDLEDGQGGSHGSGESFDQGSNQAVELEGTHSETEVVARVVARVVAKVGTMVQRDLVVR